MRRAMRAPARRQALGLSLIELMVALVLGLIVTGSALTLVLTNRQTFTATENLGRVQESARIAFELMNRELRAAGSNPCDSSIPVDNGLVDGAGNWWSNWSGPWPPPAVNNSPALRGYGAKEPFPDAGFGLGVQQRIEDTAALELKAAVPISAGNAIVMTDIGNPGNAPVQVSSLDGLHVGDLLVVCNFNYVTLFRATGFGADSIEHSVGAAASDNASATLPQHSSVLFDEGSVVSRLRSTRWYIGANGRDTDGDGVADGRSLFRASLVNNGGVLQTSLDEIAPGVTDMHVDYLVAGAADYVDASAVTNWSDPGNSVVAVRVQLTLEGDDRIGPNGETLARTLVHTVALRGRSG